MFEQFFGSADLLARHLDGPFAGNRKRFLDHCQQEGYSREHLRRFAQMLLHIASELDASTDRSMTLGQIQAAADRWWARNRRRGQDRRCRGYHTRAGFISLAVRWFRFLGRFSPTPEAPVPFSELLRDFAVWMEDERGLAKTTIAARLGAARRFFRWYGTRRRFHTVRLTDIDAYFAKCAEQGWCRISIAGEAGLLRPFFRHAGQRGWCRAAIADGIKGPRLYSQEVLPVGPSWEDVKRLLSSLHTDEPRDIRDLPMLLLFATYGLRPSEVAGLRLQDLDWEHDQILVQRRKANKTQVYPMVPQMGNAIFRYLKEVRPRSTHRAVFLTSVAPLRPLLPGSMYGVVSRRLRAMGSRTSKYGPYALRHACATHLASQGISFKVIGDHLGHSSPKSTGIYAKVDLPMLRKVAMLDLGGLR